MGMGMRMGVAWSVCDWDPLGVDNWDVGQVSTEDSIGRIPSWLGSTSTPILVSVPIPIPIPVSAPVFVPFAISRSVFISAAG
jgi:hypothetical protein